LDFVFGIYDFVCEIVSNFDIGISNLGINLSFLRAMSVNNLRKL